MRSASHIFFLVTAACVASPLLAQNIQLEQKAEGFAYVFLAEDYCTDLPKMSEEALIKFSQIIADGSYHTQYDRGFERFTSYNAKSPKDACKEARLIRKNVLGL